MYGGIDMKNLVVAGSGCAIDGTGTLRLDSETPVACTWDDVRNRIVLEGDQSANWSVDDSVGFLIGTVFWQSDTITSVFYDAEEGETLLGVYTGAVSPVSDSIYHATAFESLDNVDCNTFTDLTSDADMEVTNISNGKCLSNGFTAHGEVSGFSCGYLTLKVGATADNGCLLYELTVHGVAFTDSTLPFDPSTVLNSANFPDRLPDFSYARIVISGNWGVACTSWTGLDFEFTGTANNNGNLPGATHYFRDSSANSGIVGGTVYFFDEASNNGTLETAEFHDHSVCVQGSIASGAKFYDWSYAGASVTLPLSPTEFYDATYIERGNCTFRGTGVVSLPDADNVLKDTNYGMPSDPLTGTLEAGGPVATLPDPSQVAEGVVYGVEGGMKTGTMKTGQGIGGSGILGMP